VGGEGWGGDEGLGVFVGEGGGDWVGLRRAS
jgi:hypothetical protein